MTSAAGRTCYHCKQWVPPGEAHDCWTTTEAALTADLSEDLRDAWERLRETAAGLGDQRIYASHHSIMFSRRSCYFFVRPRRSFLELNIFLHRAVKSPQVFKVIEASSKRRVHVVRIRHRDEVESPITDWIAEAYRLQDEQQTTKAPSRASRQPARRTTRTPRAASTAGAAARTRGGRRAS